MNLGGAGVTTPFFTFVFYAHLYFWCFLKGVLPYRKWQYTVFESYVKMSHFVTFRVFQSMYLNFRAKKVDSNVEFWREISNWV